MKRSDMAIILSAMGVVYDKEIDTKKTDAYNVALGNQDRHKVMVACESLVQTNKFFPRPSEIINYIKNNYITKLSEFDELCMWAMFSRGITNPGELTEKDIKEINEKCGLLSTCDLEVDERGLVKT